MTVRVRAFSLKISFSFFAVLCVMLLLREKQTALVCFFSAMLHELGHLTFLRFFGARVSALSFGAAGVVIERADAFLLPAAQEALCALGGVFVNALLCLLSLLFHTFLPEKTVWTLFLSNALLGALNLLPVYPLDLWRALHAVLEPRLSPERLDAVMQSVSLSFLAAFAVFCAAFQRCIGRNVSLLAVLGYLLIMNLKRRTMDV